MNVVIESRKYSIEAESLACDPILLKMFASLPADFSDFDSWSFISAASDHFEKMGGKAESIGGPARALKWLSENAPR